MKRQDQHAQKQDRTQEAITVVNTLARNGFIYEGVVDGLVDAIKASASYEFAGEDDPGRAMVR